jgi:hypothetical protein
VSEIRIYWSNISQYKKKVSLALLIQLPTYMGKWAYFVFVYVNIQCLFSLFWIFRSNSGDISVQQVPESRYHDVLDHIIPIFLRDEPLSQCFPSCTTGQREQEYRAYSETQLRSGLGVMALDGSTVVGACLSRPLTRDQVMGYSIPPSDDPGMSELQCEFASYSFMSRHSTVRFK